MISSLHTKSKAILYALSVNLFLGIISPIFAMEEKEPNPNKKAKVKFRFEQSDNDRQPTLKNRPALFHRSELELQNLGNHFWNNPAIAAAQLNFLVETFLLKGFNQDIPALESIIEMINFSVKNSENAAKLRQKIPSNSMSRSLFMSPLSLLIKNNPNESVFLLRPDNKIPLTRELARQVAVGAAWSTLSNNVTIAGDSVIKKYFKYILIRSREVSNKRERQSILIEYVRLIFITFFACNNGETINRMDAMIHTQAAMNWIHWIMIELQTAVTSLTMRYLQVLEMGFFYNIGHWNQLRQQIDGDRKLDGPVKEKYIGIISDFLDEQSEEYDQGSPIKMVDEAVESYLHEDIEDIRQEADQITPTVNGKSAKELEERFEIELMIEQDVNEQSRRKRDREEVFDVPGVLELAIAPQQMEIILAGQILNHTADDVYNLCMIKLDSACQKLSGDDDFCAKLWEKRSNQNECVFYEIHKKSADAARKLWNSAKGKQRETALDSWSQSSGILVAHDYNLVLELIDYKVTSLIELFSLPHNVFVKIVPIMDEKTLLFSQNQSTMVLLLSEVQSLYQSNWKEMPESLLKNMSAFRNVIQKNFVNIDVSFDNQTIKLDELMVIEASRLKLSEPWKNWLFR